MKIFKKLFLCRFNNPKCKDSVFGCKCGIIGTTAAIIAGTAAVGAAVGSAAISSHAQRKAANRAEELAREQQQTAIAEQRRLEEKYGLTPGELSREERTFGLEKERQTELERRGGLTGEELLRETGPGTRRLLDEIAARQGKTGEELFREEGGDLGRILSEQAVSGKPTEMFESELELTRQMVNAEANRRGVFGGLPEGGIRFENLGRAGVDLAIKSARERQSQQNALLNAYLGLSSGARAEAGTVSERALTSKERASTELAQFLQDLESQSAGARNRAASVGINAAQITQPSVAKGYDTRIGLEGFRGGIQSPAEAGLSAIGQIGASYLGSKFPTGASTAPSSYEELLKGSELSSPKTRLAGLTGREMFDMYDEERRRRYLNG